MQHDQHEEVTKHLQHPRILEHQQAVQSRGGMNMNCLVEGAPRVPHTACLLPTEDVLEIWSSSSQFSREAA